MKAILGTLFLVLSFHTAIAGVTAEQQQEALKQLEVARAEINTVKSLIPGFLRKSIGQNLQNADERIAYAQQVLAGATVTAKHYCVLQTSFDGSFSGKGETELEARQNARVACAKALNSDFWCKKPATCTKQ